MKELTESYALNAEEITARLRVGENFDVIRRDLRVGEEALTFFYIDGFTKDTEIQRLMQYLLSEKKIGRASELLARLPYVEAEIVKTTDAALTGVLSFSRRPLSGRGFSSTCAPTPPAGSANRRGTRSCRGRATALSRR